MGMPNPSIKPACSWSVSPTHLRRPSLNENVSEEAAPGSKLTRRRHAMQKLHEGTTREDSQDRGVSKITGFSMDPE